MRILLAFFAAAFLLLAGCDSTQRTTTKPSIPTTVGRPSYDTAEPSSAEPDNTAVNERDRDWSNKTPIDQNENQRDVNITAEIRKAVLADKEMSINARNVKIITADGKVTLRGPVNSAAEKQAIEDIAKIHAGKENVTNEIDAKGDK